MCRQFDSAFGHQSNEPGAFRPGRLPEARGRNHPGLFAFGERFSIVDVAAKPDGALEALAIFVGLTRRAAAGARQPPKAIISVSKTPRAPSWPRRCGEANAKGRRRRALAQRLGARALIDRLQPPAMMAKNVIRLIAWLGKLAPSRRLAGAGMGMAMSRPLWLSSGGILMTRASKSICEKRRLKTFDRRSPVAAATTMGPSM